jgi:acetyltransferase-like isoleucine patch superfamily enzyme
MERGFVSRETVLEDNVTVGFGTLLLGKTRVMKNARIEANVIIGFPVRSKIKGNVKDLTEIDSEGAVVGAGTIIRSHSIIYEKTLIGNNVETGHHVLIREETLVGDNSLIGTGTVIDGYTRIGRNVKIESGVYIPPKTIIGDNVFLGPRAVITNDKYPLSKRLVGCIIENNAVIGANSTLIAGVRIGEDAVVAAGSIVTKNVPPGKVVAGSPAKIIGDRKTYEEKKRIYEKGACDTSF